MTWVMSFMLFWDMLILCASMLLVSYVIWFLMMMYLLYVDIRDYVCSLEMDENGFTIDSSWGALARNQVLLTLSLPTSPFDIPFELDVLFLSRGRDLFLEVDDVKVGNFKNLLFSFVGFYLEFYIIWVFCGIFLKLAG